MVPDRVDSDSSAQRLARLMALLELDGGARRRELERLREVDSHAAEVLERVLARGVAARARGVLAEWGTPTLRERPPGSWVGAYQIDRVLGRGGMGTVYLAHRRDPFRQEVALKLMRPGLPAHLVARFHAERQFLALLVHPGIVHLIDGGDDEDGSPYLVMEYVRGDHLSTYCGDRCATVEDRVRLVLAVAEILAFAHRRGVVHRDLKPSNILVGEDGRPRVVDFGLAKLAAAALDGSAQALTATELIVGTPSYMAPERLRAGPGRDDPGVDVYSLGVILFQLLTDRLPFTRVNSIEDWARVIQEDAPRLRRVVPSLPRDLETITAKALAREPSERFKDAGEMAEELRRYFAGEPLGIHPTTRVQRVSRWAAQRRVPLLAWGASTGVVLLVSVALLALWNHRLQQDREALRGTMRGFWLASTRLMEGVPVDIPAVSAFHEDLSRSFEEVRRRGQLAADPALDRQVAVMHRQFAASLHARGKRAEALALLDRSIALLRPLRPRINDPLVLAWTEFDLFRGLIQRSECLQGLDRLGDALGASDEALRVIRGLAGRFPYEDARLEAEARHLLDRGAMLQMLGRSADVDREVFEALALADRSVKLAGAEVDAVKLNTLCVAETRAAMLTLDFAEKERLLRSAHDIAERVQKRADTTWFVGIAYTNSMIAMGDFLLDRDRTVEALPCFEKAIVSVDRLLTRWPGDELFQVQRRDIIRALERCRRAVGVASK